MGRETIETVAKWVLIVVLIIGAGYGGYQYGRYSAFKGLVDSGLGIFDEAGKFDIKGSIKKFLEERRDKAVSFTKRCCTCCECDCSDKIECGCSSCDEALCRSALCCDCCDCRHLVVRNCQCEGCAIE